MYEIVFPINLKQSKIKTISTSISILNHGDLSKSLRFIKINFVILIIL